MGGVGGVLGVGEHITAYEEVDMGIASVVYAENVFSRLFLPSMDSLNLFGLLKCILVSTRVIPKWCQKSGPRAWTEAAGVVPGCTRLPYKVSHPTGSLRGGCLQAEPSQALLRTRPHKVCAQGFFTHWLYQGRLSLDRTFPGTGVVPSCTHTGSLRGVCL
jgi:hypothetical protein